ncbi:hypothetical protein ACWDLG_12680 [Nonomuraea sp. NPDC003727]
MTGPANVTVTTRSGGSYGVATGNARGAAAPGPVDDGGCHAPDWDAAKLYDPAADGTAEALPVRYNGRYWRAKWWTRGDRPGTGADADHEPWKDLGPTE